jgi:hypothetical protein
MIPHLSVWVRTMVCCCWVLHHPSGMMICTLFTDLSTTLSWLHSQLVHTNVDMVICQLEAAQKHSQLQISLIYIENEHAMYLNCNCLCTYFDIANGSHYFQNLST